MTFDHSFLFKQKWYSSSFKVELPNNELVIKNDFFIVKNIPVINALLIYGNSSPIPAKITLFECENGDTVFIVPWFKSGTMCDFLDDWCVDFDDEKSVVTFYVLTSVNLTKPASNRISPKDQLFEDVDIEKLVKAKQNRTIILHQGRIQ